ncbi:MAG TPA: ABC transporter permease [Aestuariivirgaceae bacterium]|nr:ABC transporter permease [Aestuariivirgaceae bacterium]
MTTRSVALPFFGLAVVLLACLAALRQVHAAGAGIGAGFWLAMLLLWIVAWTVVSALAGLEFRDALRSRLMDILVPVAFGAFLVFLWEIVTVGLNVPMVLLPAPSAIAAAFSRALPTLWADFVQTFIRAVLPGWAIGCLSGFLIAILADRVPFLARGLIPLGNFVSALPIIGIAPIMVMWFGFDWQSKVAVVVVMTVFPMLVNTVVGLSQASRLELDLMRSYGAGYWKSLVKLRLPAALPFIFNALKINSTLALIGAIVAEFFGTPIVGMGFRISTEVGRLSLDMVWAEIAVAALAGSAFYGAVALLERAATFWHPSYRTG